MPTIRVAAVPSQHPFVEAVLPRDAWSDVQAYAVPDPPGAAPGQWFPSPVLEASWIAEHAARIDLVHVHFGFEHRSLRQIQEFVTACAEHRVRLVVTAHDLDNPHLVDQSDHHLRLAELVRAAESVLTLTPGAAVRLERDFGVRAQVVWHPHIVDPQQAEQITRRAAAGRSGRRVGIFLKSLRGNTVVDPGFHHALDARLQSSGVELAVHAHADRREHPLLTELAPRWGDRLHLHERMGDTELFETVAACDVVLLPYLRGSHSGWLEMCRDLAVTVVAPDCGFFTDQADRAGAVVPYATGDAEAAARSVLEALAAGRLPIGVDRTAQYAKILAAHHDVYRGATSLGRAA